MKVVVCLCALLAVALARPQSLGENFWPETLERAQQRNYVNYDERVLSFQEAPLVNQLENVPFNEPVSIDRIVNIDAPVQIRLQSAVEEALNTY